MIQAGTRLRTGMKLGCLCGLTLAGLCAFSVFADPPPAEDPPPPAPLSLADAIQLGLERNPELMTARQQRGIAAAGVVIAQTYPFNPLLESKVRATTGPASAGITNAVDQEYLLFTEIECRGQGRYRREAAAATVTRTDWEVVNQEVALAVRVIRAFDGVVYRFQKRRLVQDSIELNERAMRQVEDLINTGAFGPADLITIRSEVLDVRAQLNLSQLALVTANAELRRALGLVDEPSQLSGDLNLPTVPEDPVLLTRAALERRPDLRARRAAMDEAEARLGLEIANRYGNVNVGPSYALDPSRVNAIGAQFTIPVPIFNTHRGEILQRRAERDQAAFSVRQTEIAVAQDVRAALARLEQARVVAEAYRKHVLPDLERNLRDMRDLYEKRERGVDILRVVDIQRKLIHARDTQLDALFEVRQALADLAAAVGDARLALGLWPGPDEGPCGP